ncbi:bifunctional DNA primase/polymerase [Halobacillus karajensis]|uniref:bifunctional DNA primase/polymerase n=1 Tax=Halobacillus karajensis TaxID=195088 RepID=UPI0009DE4FE2|nr:bifunctional DNA primase/polymerase [Halobacillus karajensis]
MVSRQRKNAPGRRCIIEGTFFKLSKNSLPQIKENITIFHKSALAYARVFKWPVFPLVPGGKSPLIDGGFHNATIDIEQINKWWTESPEAGIGLATGKISGYTVLDVDPRNGGDESLERLIEDYGSLPDTVTCLTAGGGSHYYFKYDERLTRSKTPGYEGLDLQGNGKYVVLPPSIHPNGKQYEWELSSRPDETPIAELPAWLLSVTGEATEAQKRPVSHWREILQGAGEGGRNEATASLVGHLLRRGIDTEVAYELTVLWNEGRNDPPLDIRELDKTFNSILRSEVERLKQRGR